ICKASGEQFSPPFGLYFGSSNSSLESAVFEALLNINLHYSGTSDYIVKSESSPEYHLDYWSNIHNSLELCTNKAIVLPAEIQCENVVIEHPTVGEIVVPGYVVHSQCNQLQDLFFGRTDRSKINPERLNMLKLSDIPHILT